MKDLYSIEQVAAKIGKDLAWLKKWLRENPFARDGSPHYRNAGRDKLFTLTEITLIYYQLRDIGEIAEPIDIWDGSRYEIQRPEAQGFIYFIDGGEHIKIGYSRSLESRLHKMGTDVPGEIKLLHIEPGTFKQEKVFHRHFAAIRVRGEWFRKTPELLEFIEQRKHFAAGPP